MRLKGNWGRKGRREIQKDELLIRSQLHDTINQMLRFAGCLQRSHIETLHLRAVPWREGRVGNKSPDVLSICFFSVVKSTLQGINFLCVQVVLCSHWGSQSLWPAVQESLHVSSGYIVTSSVYDDNSSRWNLTTLGIFWIARSTANGWCLGRDEWIQGDT